jgi:hypothetical protein
MQVTHFAKIKQSMVKCDGPGMMIAQCIASKKIHHQGEQVKVDQPGLIEKKLGPIWRFLPSFELELDL